MGNPLNVRNMMVNMDCEDAGDTGDATHLTNQGPCVSRINYLFYPELMRCFSRTTDIFKLRQQLVHQLVSGFGRASGV